jgi:biopolymer transport protein ExbD
LVLSVTVDGRFILGSSVRTDAELVESAKRRVADDPDVRIYVLADRSVAWLRVVQGLDLLKQGGVAKIAFVVEPTATGAGVLEHDFPKAASFGEEGGTVLAVAVLEDGSVEIDGTRKRADEIAPLVRDRLAKAPSMRAVLMGKNAARAGRVLELYKLLRDAGVANPTLAFEHAFPEPPPR